MACEEGGTAGLDEGDATGLRMDGTGPGACTQPRAAGAAILTGRRRAALNIDRRMGLSQVARAGPDQGGVGTELATLRDLAVVGGRNEILARLTGCGEIFDARSAKVMRSKVEVPRFGVVIDGLPLGYFVEFVGGHIVL